jgi:LysM repeat protein
MTINAVLSLAITVAVLYAWQSLQGPQGAPLPGAPASTRAPLPTYAPPTLEPTETPAPVSYVVQSGDTLSSIAARYDVSVEDIMAANGLSDPHALSVGQELIIPVGGLPTATPAPPTATVPATPPTPIATTTPPAGGASLVRIAEVLSPGDLAAEAVLITNDGDPVRLDGWTLADAAGDSYTFPGLTLWTGGAVTLHTGAGQDSPTDLYWNRATAAWQSGEVLVLLDADGVRQAGFSVP